MKHKRFLLFISTDFYPSGGLGDLADSFDTIEEAIHVAKESPHDRIDLYDRLEGVEINLTLYGINN